MYCRKKDCSIWNTENTLIPKSWRANAIASSGDLVSFTVRSLSLYRFHCFPTSTAPRGQLLQSSWPWWLLLPLMYLTLRNFISVFFSFRFVNHFSVSNFASTFLILILLRDSCLAVLDLFCVHVAFVVRIDWCFRLCGWEWRGFRLGIVVLIFYSWICFSFVAFRVWILGILLGIGFLVDQK